MSWRAAFSPALDAREAISHLEQALYNLRMPGEYLTEAEQSECNRRVIEWQTQHK